MISESANESEHDYNGQFVGARFEKKLFMLAIYIQFGSLTNGIVLVKAYKVFTYKAQSRPGQLTDKPETPVSEKEALVKIF